MRRPADFRLLVVEDSPTQAETLGAILDAEGYRVEIARSGEEGFERFRAGGIDLVLSDVVMPGISGYDLCRRIKSDPAGRDVPVIMLTSLSDPMDIIQGLEAGADNFVTKPYESGYLLGRVATILADRGSPDDKVRIGASVSFMGRSVTITSAKQQILNLLVGTFEEAVRKSRELEAKQKELEQANDLLEEYARQAKGQARVSSEKYAILMEQAGDGIFLLDPDGLMVEANRRMLEGAGVSREDAIGRRFLEFVPETDRSRRSSDFREVIEGRSVRLDGMHFRRPDGTLVAHDITATAVTIEGRVFVLGIARDATDRIAAERRSGVQRAVTEVLSSAAPFDEAAPRILDGVCRALDWDWGCFWLVDRAGQTLRLHSSWTSPGIDMSGYLEAASHVTHGPGTGLPGRAWTARRVLWISDVPGDGELNRSPSLTGYVVSAGIRTGVAVPIVCEGAVVAVMILGCRAPGAPDSRLIRTFETVGDHIGQYMERKHGEESLRMNEEQLRQAQKMEAVGRLAGGIAHDFNNLLTVIMGFSDLLLMKEHDAATVRKRIGQIRTAAEHAAGLTKQLLAFSRRQVLQPRAMGLGQTVAEMHQLLSRLVGEDVQILLKLDPAAGEVMADPGQIGQVVMNLAVNARDAMPHGGKLSLEVVNADLDAAGLATHPGVGPGRYVMLAVSDTGTGMDAETKARIFEPFFTTKEEGAGTGLGLSTVYGIVRQSGGTVSVCSEPGRGSTFKVYLPRLDGPVPAAPEAAVGPSGSRRVGAVTILVVEDEEAVRGLVSEILESAGHRVTMAGSPQDALALAGQADWRADLVLTDMVMPGMTGREMVTRLKEGRPELRVLFMSGYTAQAAGQQQLLQPGDAFLQKPFTPVALLDKVRETLGSS